MVLPSFIKERTPCVNHNDFLTYKTYNGMNFNTVESCTWDRLNSNSCTARWDLPGWEGPGGPSPVNNQQSMSWLCVLAAMRAASCVLSSQQVEGCGYSSLFGIH